MGKTFKDYLLEVTNENALDPTLDDQGRYNPHWNRPNPMGAIDSDKKKQKAQAKKKPVKKPKDTAYDKAWKKAQDSAFQDYMNRPMPRSPSGKYGEASVSENIKVTDKMRGEIQQWNEKFKKFTGMNGDDLPNGLIQAGLNSGILTDMYEKGEVAKFNKMKGYKGPGDSDWVEGDHGEFQDTMPITGGMLSGIADITGEIGLDDNGQVVDDVLHGDDPEYFDPQEATTEADMQRGLGSLDKFRELYRKGIGSDDDEVVLRELIEEINDDALQDDFPKLKSFISASEYDDSDIVVAKDVPGNSADEKIMSLIKAIGDDSWVEGFAQRLTKDFSMSDNEELDRIKELAGASIDETYDGDGFDEAYGDMWYNEDEDLDEAEYQGRKVKLGKPMRGDVKKFKVYVKDPKTKNVKKVNFGDPDMKIKKSNPARRRSFRARHNCDNPGPRTKARYWSCRKW